MGASIEKTDPLPGSERTRTEWPQQFAQALYDGKPEAEAPASLPGGIVDLMIFLEDRLQFGRRNTQPGIPDLDPQEPRAPTAAHENTALLRVFYGIGNQIAQHLFEQTRIATHRQGRTGITRNFKPTACA